MSHNTTLICIDCVPLCLKNSLGQHLATSNRAMRSEHTRAGDLRTLHSRCRLSAGSLLTTLCSHTLWKNKATIKYCAIFILFNCTHAIKLFTWVPCLQHV